MFNPRTDDGVLDAVTTPSLRGARYLAPYGHDGRMPSLRDFVANAVVNEFAGPPPSAQLLDALVVYIQDIDFLPNPRLDAAGHLRAASAAEQRGQALFARPFPHDPGLSCAGCHAPRPLSSITASTTSARAAGTRPRPCSTPTSNAQRWGFP